MSGLTDIRRQAELALASYATLQTGDIDDAGRDALVKQGMAEVQALRFAAEWRVIAQHTDSSFPGASATVFEEKATGKRFLAIRGTEPSLIDFISDTYFLLGVPAILNPQAVSLLPVLNQWRADGTLPSSFTIAGHSLGGFLAAGLGGAFRSNVTQAYLFNAPGVGGLGGNLHDALKAALGLSSLPLVSGVVNVRASSGLSVIAGLGAQLAPPIFVETEPGNSVLDNHKIWRLTDGLAVAGLLARLDPALRDDQIRTIVRAGEFAKTLRLERAVNSVAQILGTPEALAENRDSLFEAIAQIEARVPEGAPSPYQVKVLAGLSASSIRSEAQSNIAYRYALDRLNAFALLGADYAQFASQLAETGERYLGDRAEMLASWLKMNGNDVGVLDGGNPLPPDGRARLLRRSSDRRASAGRRQRGNEHGFHDERRVWQRWCGYAAGRRGRRSALRRPGSGYAQWWSRSRPAGRGRGRGHLSDQRRRWRGHDRRL